MKIVPPNELIIVSSSVADSTLSAYMGSQAYAIGDKIKGDGEDGFTHEYESLMDNNLSYPITDPTKWLDLGASNKYAMFDTKTSTTTKNSTSIKVTIKPKSKTFDTVAIVNLLNVKQVKITVSDFTKTIDTLVDSSDWIDALFDPFHYHRQVVVNVGLRYSSEQAVIEFTGDGNIECGVCLLGLSKDLGMTKYGVNVGIIDYSSKETDEFGDTYLLKRAYADTADIQMVIPTLHVDFVKSTLAKVRATPCLFQLNNSDDDVIDAMVIYGFYNDFGVDIAYHSVSYCSLSVESLA